MEFVRLIGAIRSRWKLLVAGAVVAVALVISLDKPPTSSSAVAWTRVMVDTPNSQVIKADPRGADSLAWRAALLVHLMATDDTVREIARRLGVRSEEVAVIDPALAEPQVPASMPVSAAEAASSSVAPNVLTVYIDVAQLPVISVEAAAPNREAANRLAEAAVDILEARSSPTETRYTSRILTGGGAALKHQTYVVEPVAPVRTKEIVSRAAPTKQVGVVLLLGVWCAGVLAVPALLRRRVRLRVAPSAGGGPGFRPTPRPPARTE